MHPPATSYPTTNTRGSTKFLKHPPATTTAAIKLLLYPAATTAACGTDTGVRRPPLPAPGCCSETSCLSCLTTLTLLQQALAMLLQQLFLCCRFYSGSTLAAPVVGRAPTHMAASPYIRRCGSYSRRYK